MFKKLREYIKAIFEGKRCRFSKECELYNKDNAVCNDWVKRFPTHDKVYCGRYRELEEGENYAKKADR